MGARPDGVNRVAIGLILAGAVGVAGAGADLALLNRVDAEHAASMRSAKQNLAQTVQMRIARLSSRVDQYAAELTRLPTPTRPESVLAAAPRTDFSSFLLASPDLPVRAASGGSLPPALNGGSSYLQNAAVTARDSAAPVAVVTKAGRSSELVVLWPLYRGAPPASTQARRADSAGWVVGATSVDAVMGPVLAADRVFGATTSVVVTPAGPATVPATLRGGVVAEVTAVPGPSRLGVLLIALLAVFACAGILGCTALVRRRDRHMQRGQTALDEQVSLVTETSVTIQESLDLGVVLPAVLAQVSHRLALSWIRIVTGPATAEVEILALGRRRSLPTPRWSGDASTAVAGQLIRLPLRRATRTLGHLELIPTGELNAYQLTSLRQCADLLAGALHNAELYEREQESVRRLRDLDALKDDFLGTVSHELRTPLTVLGGSVALLTANWEQLPDDSRRRTVATMQPHVASLANLLNDLLDFVSDRRTVASASLSTVQLDREIRQLAEQLRPLVHRQELELVAPEPITAWTDVRALERIIGNLVGNAGKYSPAGTTIRIEVRRELDEALVSVSDQGPGIRSEDRERIFERFYRGDSDAARTTRGSGIGLAVAMTWIRAVGARLEVRTETGLGTTMTVRFPISQDADVGAAGTITWRPAEVSDEELVQ